MEIFSKNQRVLNISLDNFHETIHDNAVMGKAFVWNKNEDKFLYLAEAKKKPEKFFLDQDGEVGEDCGEYKQDCGEQMVGIMNPQLFQYDLTEQKLEKIELPENIVPCFPSYIDEIGTKIVFSGFTIHPEFRYGIIHCFNRESQIYYMDDLVKTQIYPKPEEKKDEQVEKAEKVEEKKLSKYKIISKEDVCLRSQCSPDGKKLIYFATSFKPSHVSYMGLKLLNTETFEIQQLIEPSHQYKKGEFMGVCGYYDLLKDSYWMKDSINFIFPSIQESRLVHFICNTQSKQIQNIGAKFTYENKISGMDYFTSLNFDRKQSILYANYENPFQIARIATLNLQQYENKLSLDNLQAQWNNFPYQGFSLELTQLNTVIEKYFQEEIIYEGNAQGYFWSLKDDFLQDSNLQFPKELKDLWDNQEKLNLTKLNNSQKPLLVLIHGGPHSCMLGQFAISRLYFLLNGYNILAPNFSGSCGYGQKFIEDLLGNIGELDLKEILGMVEQIKKRTMCDPGKIISMGGSYGGYLGGIIASRAYDIFKCAVLMNPCTNLPFMINTTDIPEWISAEVFKSERIVWNHTPDDYAKMLEKSPALSPAKIPICLILGQKDLRVPYQQSLAYAAQAKKQGTPVKTYLYPESNHNLDDSPQTIFSVLMNSINFIEEHILK